MPATPDQVLARLQGGALASLVTLVVDDLLTRPVDSLLDPEFVADQVIAALETAGSGERPEAWLREQIDSLRSRVPDGTLGQRAPAEVVDPLRDALGRPIVWDRELVGALLDHDAMRSVFREVVTKAVTSYGKKLAHLSQNNAVTQAAGRLGLGQRGGGLSRLKTLGEGLAKGISAELEHQAEDRVKDFVDQAMGRVMIQVADHLCDPAYADQYGRYRVHIVDTLLHTELRTLADELEKIDPDSLVATGAGIARSLSRREGFRDEVADAARKAMTEAGGRSLRDFLAETGIDEARWRADIEVQVVARGADLLETDAFREWLEALLG
ncbi:MAG: hypothetical protein H6742_08180 [Alphaproteobacteria bacterium]|nr:hypothetical protein [Alphaproteobacteria bacterium]